MRGFSAILASLLTYEKVLIVLLREILDGVSTDFLHSLQIVVVWRRKSALRIERERLTLLHHLRSMREGHRLLLQFICVNRCGLPIHIHHASVDDRALNAGDAELVVDKLLVWILVCGASHSHLVLRLILAICCQVWLTNELAAGFLLLVVVAELESLLLHDVRAQSKLVYWLL